MNATDENKKNGSEVGMLSWHLNHYFDSTEYLIDHMPKDDYEYLFMSMITHVIFVIARRVDGAIRQNAKRQLRTFAIQQNLRFGDQFPLLTFKLEQCVKKMQIEHHYLQDFLFAESSDV